MIIHPWAVLSNTKAVFGDVLYERGSETNGGAALEYGFAWLRSWCGEICLVSTMSELLNRWNWRAYYANVVEKDNE